MEVEEDNTLTTQRDEEAVVSANAALKAQAAAAAYDDAIVIGADTIVSLDGVIFGKPVDRQTPKECWRLCPAILIRFIPVFA